MREQRVLKLLLVVSTAFLFVSPTIARAQSTSGAATAENGFQPNRDYLALQPWESIDTSSGNVVLTFTDLALPGNAGHALRFERVYNNQLMGPAVTNWRFSISGLPLKVVHPAPPSPELIGDTIVGNRQFSPYLEMADGSNQQTVFEQPPTTSMAWVVTPQFWRYHVPSRTLYLPDGRIAEYGVGDGRLVRIRDQFTVLSPPANVTTLTWTSTSLHVVQALGQGESRTVDFVLDAGTGLPTQMTFHGGGTQGDRTWTYDYYAGGKLRQVTSPVPGAAPWLYEYEVPGGGGKMYTVTTPQGGVVTYDYELQWFYFGPNPEDRAQASVLRTRAVSGTDLVAGTWDFTYVGFTGPAGMKVRLPSGFYVSHDYGIQSGYMPSMLAGDWVLRYRTVYATDGVTPIEQEERQYASLRAARPDRDWFVPVPAVVIVQRSGRTYRTELTFDPDNTGGFSNYHRPRFKTERVNGVAVRSAEFGYQHFTLATSPVYVVGLPLFETLTETAAPLTRQWDYEATTGFQTHESLYGITTTFTRDGLGNVAVVRKANNKQTTISYSFGQVKDTSSALVTTARTINVDGTVASETVAGRTTGFAYDELSRLRFRYPPGANAIETQYDLAGQWMRVLRGSTVEEVSFDGFGRPVRTQNAVGIKTHTRYTAEGRKVYQSLPFVGGFDTPADIGMTYTYDALGRVTFEENPDGTFRSHNYGTADADTVSDEKLRPTVFTYKAYGHPDDTRLAGVLDAAGSPWNYTYNTAGSLTGVSGPGGVTRSWVYDARNLLTSETHPESGQVRSDQLGDYDAAGVLLKKRDANGTTFTYVYDEDDRLASIISGAQAITFGYEAGSNNRTSMSVSGSAPTSTAFGYDAPTGRLSTRTDAVDGKAFQTSYSYDGNDNVTGIWYPSGRRVGYEYDMANRVTRVFNGYSSGDSYAHTFVYHPSGGIANYTAKNGVVTTIGYHPTRYWVASIQAASLRLAYSYDEVGNVLGINDLVRPTYAQTFTYDNLDRLATSGSGGAFGIGTYNYDAHGNRATNATSTFTYYPGRPFHLQSLNGALGMTYAANGNLTTGIGVTLTYTPNNLLRRSSAGGSVVSFAYDADDWRVKKQVDGGVTTYFVRGLGGQLLTEWANNSPATAPNADVKDLIYVGNRLIGAFKAALPKK